MKFGTISAIAMALLLCWGPILGLTPPRAQETSLAVNVEVPIRVMLNDTFVTDLTIDDLEVLENGIPQNIEALYLVENGKIIGRFGTESVLEGPSVPRNHHLIVQMTEYSPDLKKSIEYFFNNIVSPNDFVTLQTPISVGTLSPQHLNSIPKEKLIKDTIQKIKKDLKKGYGYYRGALSELTRLTRMLRSVFSGDGMAGVMTEFDDNTTDNAFNSSPSVFLPQYKEKLMELESIQGFNQKAFINYARSIKERKEKNIIHFLYEKEFRPELDHKIINALTTTYQEVDGVNANIQDITSIYNRRESYNVKELKEAFADSGALFNLIFVDRKERESYGVFLREKSQELFSALKEVAEATGEMLSVL